jgi:hypothetical protein
MSLNTFKSVEQIQEFYNDNGNNGWENTQLSPDLTDLSNCFYNMPDFNGAIGRWDTSHVKNTRYMFQGAEKFNQDISGWVMSSVTNTAFMFYGASSFNQDISEWVMSNVTDTSFMFNGAICFNQDIRGWECDNLNEAYWMLNGTAHTPELREKIEASLSTQMLEREND